MEFGGQLHAFSLHAGVFIGHVVHAAESLINGVLESLINGVKESLINESLIN